MKTVHVHQVESGVLLGSKVAVADSWWRRLRGLLGRPRMQYGEGLLLLECDAVHTVGMAYPIDVVFIGAGGMVVRHYDRLSPWKLGFGGAGAVHALELPAGRLAETGTVPGSRCAARRNAGKPRRWPGHRHSCLESR